MAETRETVAVPANAEGVGAAMAAFETFVAARGVPAPASRRFLVALDEVLSNIVRHGRPSPATIDLTFSLAEEVLEVELVDSTGPFNPLDAPPPDTSAPLDARRPGGVGIALVRAVMDRVRYERRGERNVLTLSARLAPAGAGD